QISKHLGVQLALTDLFRYSVLQDQALLIDNSQKTVFASIPQSPVQADYPLSSSQKRMWILSQFEAGNVAYSIPSSHHIQGSLDLVSLEESFRRIVSRHEILRT
ncbi:hypothetical protein GFU89_23210, partial [Chryseobacterium sp. JV558]|nr:hypothetical protein [Chryseobacterium sp. JV558]